jgi:hypothetical protein
MFAPAHRALLNLSRKKDDECASSATVSINSRAKPPPEPAAAPDQPSEAVARLTAWLGIRTLICRKKIHPFEKAPEFGFMASYADGRELIGE